MSIWSWASNSRCHCLNRGFGPDDLQISVPTSHILWSGIWSTEVWCGSTMSVLCICWQWSSFELLALGSQLACKEHQKEPWIHSMVDTLCGNLPCLQPWIKNGGQHFEHGSGVLGVIYNDLKYWCKANLQKKKKRGIPSVQWTANVDALICNVCYRYCLYMHIQTDKFSSGWRCLEGTFTVRSAWPENVGCGGS